MLAGYTQHEEPMLGLLVFREMVDAGILMGWLWMGMRCSSGSNLEMEDGDEIDAMLHQTGGGCVGASNYMSMRKPSFRIQALVDVKRQKAMEWTQRIRDDAPMIKEERIDARSMRIRLKSSFSSIANQTAYCLHP
ncbi:hypothetical protein HHK36_020289 [Tetracentron sinense]|uniref:Uncharacterized protein n=1 Tax=Tetracentron sinense TaxID=13715 RepID=A0A835DBH4_TETSI|nr:hypothetical protein HHK36_020289 [Tetracentron sinense]